MPPRPKRPCAYPGCPALVESGYCDKHKADANTGGYGRGTANSRGYDYTWQCFRRDYLREHPLCVDCLANTPSIVTLATDVHHVHKLRYFPFLKYVESNLMALCGPCHDERTRLGE